MPSPRTTKKPPPAKPHGVKLILRDGVVVEGGFFLTEGQPLAPYLASRRGGWVNMVGAKWAGEGETHHHAVLQVDQILIACSTDAEIPVFRPTRGAPRTVDIGLDDGSRVGGALHLGALQRLSDYLFVCGKFLPVLHAQLMPGGEPLGDIALNALCVKVVRAAPNTPNAALDPGGPRPTGAFEAFTDDVFEPPAAIAPRYFREYSRYATA